mmetsp:Transcript_45678/g.106033  ORF Transcript_45678/g.106033 Transcript_45678/m.106033 type:complete len:206 (-) Transcript_45678:846-1463(-)
MTHACPHSAAEIGRTAAQLMALEEAEARCRTGQAKQLNQSQRPAPPVRACFRWQHSPRSWKSLDQPVGRRSVPKVSKAAQLGAPAANQRSSVFALVPRLASTRLVAPAVPQMPFSHLLQPSRSPLACLLRGLPHQEGCAMFPLCHLCWLVWRSWILQLAQQQPSPCQPPPGAKLFVEVQRMWEAALRLLGESSLSFHASLAGEVS